MGINLQSFVYPPSRVDYTAANVLRQVKYKMSANEYIVSSGLVTSGYILAYQESGGISSAICSKPINFSYVYVERPNFSWGLDSGIQSDDINATFGATISDELKDFFDSSTYSPAIFVPRVIQWNRTSITTFSGCVLMVTQINPDCTEVEKFVRIHFRFEGKGFVNPANTGGTTE
jgi:hypothetical protein